MSNRPEKEKSQKPAVCGLSNTDEELRKILSPEQYRITRLSGTEAPFTNKYWDNKKAGIYVDIISGEPLFGSADKFDSGTGWPSFIRPIEKDSLIEKEDKTHGMIRTEVRSKKADSHLGHLFNDGPEPTGLRYCINSASLRFIPVEDLEKEGYGKYLYLFGKQENVATDKRSDRGLETATFGAGCFWGVESVFSQQKGVVGTEVGYMGGKLKNPTYKDVCTDKTGHAEVVQVRFDPSKISYERLLEIFFSIHDPTTPNRQGPDVGSQYRSIIFYHNTEQKDQAARYKKKLEESKTFRHPLVTEIVSAEEFWKAEDYHQKYFQNRGIIPTCHIPPEK